MGRLFLTFSLLFHVPRIQGEFSAWPRKGGGEIRAIPCPHGTALQVLKLVRPLPLNPDGFRI